MDTRVFYHITLAQGSIHASREDFAHIFFKWPSSIIYHLKDQPVRFNDLCRMLGGAGKKMIDLRLKKLELKGLVVREVLETRSIAVSYRLTEFGHSALGILETLRRWSEAHEI